MRMKRLLSEITILVMLVAYMFAPATKSFPVPGRPIQLDDPAVAAAVAAGNRLLGITESAAADAVPQFRLSDSVAEVEWLLRQLVDILTEMVNGIEQDPTMLHNRNFRLILVQVIKRIDYILEHFEQVGPALPSYSALQFELGRIDCIRIRLINYVSQSNKQDDTKCRPSRPTPAAAGSDHDDDDGHSSHQKEMMTVLNQIVSLLSRISGQLSAIEKELHHHHHGQHGNADPAAGSSTSGPLTRAPWASHHRRPGTTIDWDAILGTVAASTTTSTVRPDQTRTSDADMTTMPWEHLISQVMDSMGQTLRPGETTTADPPAVSITANAATTTTGTGTTFTLVPPNGNWEDLMNQLIRQWNRPSGSRN